MRSKLALLIIIFIFCHISISQALETDTHKTINEYISRNTLSGFSLGSYLLNSLDFSGGADELIKGQEVYKWIRDGGYYEDKPNWYTPYLRSVNHFHNPLTDEGFSGIWGIGILSGDSSIQWSQRSPGTQWPGGHYSWHDVRGYFYNALTAPDKTTRDDNYAETFRGLGQLMHLVQDLSVPEHTRDDGHYLPAYESWVKKPENVYIDPETGLISIVDISKTPIPFDQSAIGTPNTLASVPVANLFDTNQYTETNLNPDVTLRADIGLSEYTNANFLSGDTIFSSNFTHPALASTQIEDSVIIDPRDPQGLVSCQVNKVG